MRSQLRIILIVLIVVLFLWSLASFLVTTKGSQIIVHKLEGYTKRKVAVNSVYLKPLIGLEIEGLDISGLARIERLYITPSILGLLTGRIALNEIKIIRPECIFERNPVAAASTPAVSTGTESTASPPPSGLSLAQSAKRQIVHFVIKHIIIRDGKIDFYDKTVGGDGVRITVKDLYFYLDNLFLMPQSVVTNFNLNSKIPWYNRTQDGEVILSGWINLFKKDMQATLEIKNIDGVALYPYYNKWVDLEGARIQQAKLQFKSDVIGHNNDITANCRLELTDIVFRPKAEGEEEHKAHRIATVILGMFKALDKGRAALNFTVRTQMDRPEFGFENIRMAFEDKVASVTKSPNKTGVEDLMTLPANLIKGTLEGTTNITRTLIESTIAVGKSLGGTVVDILKKDNKDRKE